MQNCTYKCKSSNISVRRLSINVKSLAKDVKV